MSNTKPREKDAAVSFRLTSEVRDLMKRLAVSDGRTVTSYIEQLVKQQAKVKGWINAEN